MINLKKLVGSKVRIVDIDDITYEGMVKSSSIRLNLKQPR